MQWLLGLHRKRDGGRGPGAVPVSGAFKIKGGGEVLKVQLQCDNADRKEGFLKGLASFSWQN